MEYRRYANSPEFEEQNVCSISEKCKGCPFPSTGFICWGSDGECLRTRFEKLQRKEYAAACGVSDRVLWQILKDRPHIKKAYLCFDNDEKGQQAANRISRKLNDQGIWNEILTPAAKDWNEDLLLSRKGKQ